MIAIIYMFAALEFASWEGGLLAGFALPEAVFTVPLIVGEVFVWISVALAAISGADYVWLNRRHFIHDR